MALFDATVRDALTAVGFGFGSATKPAGGSEAVSVIGGGLIAGSTAVGGSIAGSTAVGGAGAILIDSGSAAG